MAYRIMTADESPAMRTFIRRVIHLSVRQAPACIDVSDKFEAHAVALPRGHFAVHLRTEVGECCPGEKSAS